MHNSWTPQRAPDEVPTPVAIALSDFCRQAQAPAPPAMVRAALAYLSAEEDFRLEAFARSTPPSSPLGPFAVVDILKGTSPEIAAMREKTDYYAWVKQLPLQPKLTPTPSPTPPSGLQTAPSPPLEASLPPSLLPPSQKTWSLGKPYAPPHKPRGRFIQVEPGKENLRLLFRAEAKERVCLLMESSRTQVELLSLFSSQFRGEGEALTWKEVSSVLGYHGLLAVFEEKERTTLREGLCRFRCSLDKLSKAWEIRPVALKKRIEALSLEEEFDTLRKRFAAEILDSPNLNSQLRVLARPGYMKDLGIASALKKQLSAKLKTMLAQLPPELEMPELQLRELAKQHRLDKNLLSAALEQLKLF